MHFDAGAVQAKAVDGHADHVVFLKRIKQSVQDARICPTPHTGVNRVPLAETWRQSPPFAAVFGHKEDGIDHGQVRNPYISALNGQVGADQRVLIFSYLIYNRYLAQTRAMQ